ncbi:hypothetical protein ACFVH6_25700 [Spirillospora sp. NPDC127200]
MLRYRIFVREALHPNSWETGLGPLELAGELTTYTSFTAVSRLNDVGTWTLEIPSASEQSRLLTPGRGVVVFREGAQDPLFSGPIRSIEKSWNADDNPGAGTVKVAGVDDNIFLAERLAWTVPGSDIALASKAAHWATNKAWPNIGELIRNLLLQNATTQKDRWVTRLYISREDSGLTDDDTANSVLLRFNEIGSEIKKMALVYGFRISCMWHPAAAEVGDGAGYSPGPGLLVRIQAVDDLSSVVQFGAHLGNLQDYTYSVSAPEATRVVVGTQHRRWKELKRTPTYDQNNKLTGYTETEVERVGRERYYDYFKNEDYDPEWWGDAATTPPEMAYTLPFAQRGLTAAEVEWGVTAERFIDLSQVDWPWLQDPKRPAGYPMDPPVWSRQYRAIHDEVDKELTESGPGATITISPVETPTTPAWWDDYSLGDTVRVHIDGEVRDEVVREVELSADEDGHRVKPVLGTEGSSGSPYLYRQVKSLWLRVHDLASREDLVPEDPVTPMPLFGFTRVEEAA